jgi:hypothetical protein
MINAVVVVDWNGLMFLLCDLKDCDGEESEAEKARF